jgi:hypothetical protein
MRGIAEKPRDRADARPQLEPDLLVAECSPSRGFPELSGTKFIH